MDKRIVAGVIVVIVAVGVGAYLLLKAPTAEGGWIKEDGIRVSDGVSSCTIVLPDSTYRMYYTGMGGILSATSSDGLTWTKESGMRVGPGEPGSYDETMATNPGVIVLDDGTYRMIYEGMMGQEPNETRRLLSATSTDGLTWTKEEGIRLDSVGAPDYGFVSVPDIIRLPDGRYRMYYVGDGHGKGPKESHNTIRCAVSSDNGLTWERETITGIPAHCVDPDVIRLPDGTYRMFYTAPPPGEFPGNLHVYSALSSDGLNWTKEEGVILAPGGQYDRALCLDPDVVELPDGSYRMYYSGQSEEPEGVIHILSARSP